MENSMYSKSKKIYIVVKPLIFSRVVIMYFISGLIDFLIYRYCSNIFGSVQADYNQFKNENYFRLNPYEWAGADISFDCIGIATGLFLILAIFSIIEAIILITIMKKSENYLVFEEETHRLEGKVYKLRFGIIPIANKFSIDFSQVIKTEILDKYYNVTFRGANGTETFSARYDNYNKVSDFDKKLGEAVEAFVKGKTTVEKSESMNQNTSTTLVSESNPQIQEDTRTEEQKIKDEEKRRKMICSFVNGLLLKTDFDEIKKFQDSYFNTTALAYLKEIVPNVETFKNLDDYKTELNKILQKYQA